MSYRPKLTETKDASVFADELNIYIDEIKELPYGLVVLIIDRMKSLKTEDMAEGEKHLIEQAYYFIMPWLLSNDNKRISFTKQDVEKLETLTMSIIRSIAMLDAYLRDMVSVKMVNGEWEFTLNDKQMKAIEKYLKNRGDDE